MEEESNIIKKLLLLYNSYAGKARIGQSLDMIITCFYQDGYEVTVAPISPPIGAESILQESETLFDVVVCCGGDGTLNHTVSGLMLLDPRPLLGYIPSGSTNDFATTVGIPQNIQQACDAVVHGIPFAYDVGQFGEDRYFNYVAGCGAFTEVSYGTPQATKNAIGYAAYLLEALKHLPINQSFHAEVLVDGKQVEGEFLYASVSNSRSIAGMSLHGKIPVELDDGIFEVLLVRAPQNLMQLQNTLAHLLSRDFSGGDLILLAGQQIRFELEKKLPWTLDGEYGGDYQNCDISIRRRAVQLLRPADDADIGKGEEENPPES